MVDQVAVSYTHLNVMSWYGTFTYDYMNRYIVNFNIRADGSKDVYKRQVRHNCAKVLKLKNRYNLQLEEEYIDEPVYSEEEFEGECRKLYAEIARLPEQCRKVFELIVLKDMKYKEVADFLGLSVNTVKTHFARALKQLRSSLQILLVFFLRK